MCVDFSPEWNSIDHVPLCFIAQLMVNRTVRVVFWTLSPLHHWTGVLHTIKQTKIRLSLSRTTQNHKIPVQSTDELQKWFELTVNINMQTVTDETGNASFINELTHLAGTQHVWGICILQWFIFHKGFTILHFKKKNKILANTGRQTHYHLQVKKKKENDEYFFQQGSRSDSKDI